MKNTIISGRNPYYWVSALLVLSLLFTTLPAAAQVSEVDQAVGSKGASRSTVAPSLALLSVEEIEAASDKEVTSEEKADLWPEQVLAVRQSFAPTAAGPGDLVEVSISVENISDSELTGISVGDRLPPGLTLADAGDGQLDDDAGQWTLSLGTLSPGAVAKTRLKVQVDDSASAALPNLVSVNADALVVPAVSVRELTVTGAREAKLLPGGVITVGVGSSIQDAIDAADPGTTIKVEEGIFGEMLLITKSLTLEGGYNQTFTTRTPRTTVLGFGTTITDVVPASPGSVMNIVGSSLDVTVDGFEITGGNAASAFGRGGGIYADVDTDSVLIIQDNYIHDNYASDDGGGIYADGEVRSQVAIVANTVMSNTTGDDGAGLYASTYMSGTLILTDNEISCNASGDDYGGLYASASYLSVFDVSRNQIISNTAMTGSGYSGADYGGGYLEFEYNSDGQVDDNLVVGNQASDYVGGWYVYAYYGSSGSFLRNTFRDNEADRRGGLYLEAYGVSEWKGSDLVLEGNRAKNGYYGGGYIYADYASSISLPDSDVVANRADHAYGGVYLYTYDNSTILAPSLYVYSNTAGTEYGGLGLEASDGNDTVIATGAQVISNTAESVGGGAYVYADDAGLVDLRESRFEGNVAGTSGGAIYVDDGPSYGSSLLLDDAVFVGNEAGSDGGALWIDYMDYDGLLHCVGADFIGNVAEGNGGAIYLEDIDYGSQAIIEECLFQENVAGEDGGAYYGDYFAYDGSESSFSHNTVISNTAGSDGGGFYVDYLATDGSVAYFNDNWIEGNVAGDYGGGACLYNVYSASYAEINDNTIISNTSGGYGAGLYLGDIEYGSEAHVEGNVISGNVISGTSQYYGGGIYLYGVDEGSTLWMLNNVINDNVATGYGGALFVDDYIDYGSYLYFEDNEVRGNWAGSDGGAIYFEDYIYDGSELHVNRNVFADNVAMGDGGALHVYDIEYAIAEFAHNEFLNNTAGGDYGALYFVDVSYGASMRFVGNTVQGNRAGISGTQVVGGDFGGICYDYIGDGATVLFAENSVVSNTAYMTGTAGGDYGGFRAGVEAGGLLRMVDNDISCNEAQGHYAGLSVNLSASRLELIANRIMHNVAGLFGSGVNIYGDEDAQYFMRRNKIVGNVAGGLTNGGGRDEALSDPYLTAGVLIEDGDDSLWGRSVNNLIADNGDIGVRLWNADYHSVNDTIADQEIGIAMTGTVTSTAELYNGILGGGFETPYTNRFTMTAEYSDVEGGWPGPGNIDEYPGFVGGGSYELTAGSPCIDVASPVYAPSIDIRGWDRPYPMGGLPDMGCYEWQLYMSYLPFIVNMGGGGSLD